MIEITTILTHSIAYALGLVTAYVIVKTTNILSDINILIQKVNELEKKILTPIEMAKKILTMKMPMKDLPPELIEQFRLEAERKPKKMENPSYTG